MPNWDVFHSDQLQVERDLTTPQVHAKVAQGEIHEDDLVRTAGSSDPWRRIGDIPSLFKAPPSPQQPPASSIPTAILLDDLNEDRAPSVGPTPVVREVVADDRADLRGQLGDRRPGDSDLALPVMPEEEPEPEYDPLAEDAEAADFTFSARGGKEIEEDLDLAAMVDVAFQLILFFLVTASTVMFKSVEIPPPDPEKAKGAKQAVSRTIQDLQNDHILVEIDARGQYLVDHSPVSAENLANQMRSIREQSGRTSMLLMADRATPHKFVVQALDAANEISLSIKIGRASAE
jgi:biopolymer transport protein ExbD